MACLVTLGIKKATASCLELYQIENEKLPEVGEYSVIIVSRDRGVAVIQTTSLKSIPFFEVGENHAYKEGEGNQNLTYWRKVHKKVSTQYYQEDGVLFNENTPVLCEEFRLLYSLYEVKDLNENEVDDILSWKYDGIYSCYNMSSKEKCFSRNWVLVNSEKRKNKYFGLYYKQEFIDFFHIINKDAHIEVVIGLKPSFCDKGHGFYL